MNRIVVTPKASDKLLQIKTYIEEQFDPDTAKRTVMEITAGIKRLKKNAYLGISVAELFDVDTDYRKIFVAHNHIFYKVDGDVIRIVDIYHEREDFMLHLFGISSIDPDAERYWDDVEQK